MRIGYDTLVENPLNPSSAIVYLKRVLDGLCRLAPEHEIYALVSPRNRHLFTFDHPNLTLVNCHVSNEHVPARILVQQLFFPRVARRYHLDVIHALNQVPLWAGTATVVKTCTFHHHLTPEEFGSGAARQAVVNRARQFYRSMMLDQSARRATLALANSEFTARMLRELMHVPAERIRMVYESVDEVFGDPNERVTPAQLREQFGVSGPYVLYASNLWFYKNPDGAIRALAERRKRFGGALELVVAGPDDYCQIPALTALATSLGIADAVHFVGRVSRRDLVRLYSGARVIFYPSRAETFGKPAVEAMKAGVPLVIARAGSLPEIAGEAALSAGPDDVAGLAEALNIAAFDEDTRGRLIAAGRERGAFFTWERTARGTLAACIEAATLWAQNRGGRDGADGAAGAGSGARES